MIKAGPSMQPFGMWTPKNTNKAKSQQITLSPEPEEVQKQNKKKKQPTWSIPAHLKRLLNFGVFINFSFACGFNKPIYKSG